MIFYTFYVLFLYLFLEAYLFFSRNEIDKNYVDDYSDYDDIYQYYPIHYFVRVSY